jgi:hypothetical protein
VEILYGEQAVTPNMHMHVHLIDVMKNFGPVREFWLFSFERYNGLLSHQPKGTYMIESQLMKRFLYDSFADSFRFPSEFTADFSSVYHFKDKRYCGSVKQSPEPQSDDAYELPKQSTRSILYDSDKQNICKIYEQQHPGVEVVSVNSVYLKYRSMVICGKQYNANHKSVPLVKWDSQLFSNEPTTLNSVLQDQPHYWKRPIKVHYFAKNSLMCKNPDSSSPFQESILLAVASWYYPHSMRFACGNPVQVWCSDIFESHGLHTYVPLHLFTARCAHCVRNFNSQNLLFVTPLVE